MAGGPTDYSVSLWEDWKQGFSIHKVIHRPVLRSIEPANLSSYSTYPRGGLQFYP
jgi:hypothetical protein